MGAVREGWLHGGLPYLAIGSGPPLVVFVGLSSRHASPKGAARRLNLRPLEPLAARFTVYSVNRKPGLTRGSTIADLAGHYAEAIREEFGGPVPIYGVSTGGSVAQQFAIDHPDLVRRLVLVSTACRLSQPGREAQGRLAELAATGRKRRAWASLGPPLAATAIGGRLMASLLWLVGPVMSGDDPADMIATIAAEAAFDASAELHRIGAPTLLIAGERDGFYSPSLFRETAERIPDARLCLYPGRGHGVFGHEPAIREILEFLAAGLREDGHRAEA